MKKIGLIFVSFFLLLGFYQSVYAETLDKVVAIVNSEPITQNELTQQMGIAKAQLQAAHLATPSDQKLRQMVLNKLIDMKLQLQMAKKAHIIVTDQQVAQTIAKIAAKNNMSVSQLKSAIQQHNMSYANYMQQIHDEMVLSQVTQSQVIPTIKLSEAEIAQAKAALIKKGVKTDLDNKARMMLLQKKYPEAMQMWLTQLRSQAYVQILTH